MSNTLSSVAVEQFDTEVKHAYQGGAKLKGTCTVRNGVVGDSYDFRKMGKGMAQERTAPSADAVPMNIDHSVQVAVLSDWDAPEYTDIFNDAEVNFDEVQELGQTIAQALGRRDDQICIDAMKGGTYSATPTAGQGGLVAEAGTGVLTVAKLAAGKFFLDDKEIDEMDRFCLINAKGLSQLLDDPEITSADYNTVKSLVRGEVDTYLGFKFITIGTRSEGGLTVAANIHDAFMWHKSAVGKAVGIDIRTRVDWVAHKDSWKSTGYLKAGAVLRDNEGVVKLQYYAA